MAREYVGFDKNLEATARRVVNRAASAAAAADKALIAATGAKATANADLDKLVSKWFGNFTASASGQLSDLKDKIHKMVYVLDLTPFKVTMGAANGNENAVATHYAANQANLSAYTRRGMAAFNELKLRPRFFKNMTESSATKQSQVETIVHEISHIAFTSADEVLPAASPNAGQKAYEAENALWLAENSADQAFNNAENFGFFVMEFLDKK